MTDDELLALLVRHQDGTLDAAGNAALEAALAADPGRRRLFIDAQVCSFALHERFRHDAFRAAGRPPSRPARRGRGVAALVAGVVLGLLGASLVWAVSAPHTTTERLFSLRDGGFAEGPIGRGFPREPGIWSGDDAALTADGRLRFVAPGSDPANPAAEAIACDVFQIVDLRPLRRGPSAAGDALLELSAGFLDARPPGTGPSVTFFCQLWLFAGDAAGLHATWPQGIPRSLASGSAAIDSLGGGPAAWHTLTARCVVPAHADFAVVQISARPNLRPAALTGLFADDVQLTLRVSPPLPERVVRR
jgi:hypothetical protein